MANRKTANSQRAAAPAKSKSSEARAAARGRQTKSGPKSKAKSTAPRKRAAQSTPKRAEPAHEEIQLAAYEIYQTRIGNGDGGDENSDWFEATRRLMC